MNNDRHSIIYYLNISTRKEVKCRLLLLILSLKGFAR